VVRVYRINQSLLGVQSQEEQEKLDKITEELLSLVASPEVLNCVVKTGEEEGDLEMYQTELIELDNEVSLFILEHSQDGGEEEQDEERQAVVEAYQYLWYILLLYNLSYEKDQEEVAEPQIQISEETFRMVFYILYTQKWSEQVFQNPENVEMVS
jgi:hypothetical protein